MSDRERLVEALEAERLRPVPRRGPGGRLVCQWARHSYAEDAVGWAHDPESLDWLPVCRVHRDEAEHDGLATRDRL